MEFAPPPESFGKYGSPLGFADGGQPEPKHCGTKRPGITSLTDVNCTVFGVCASYAVVRPTTMTSEAGDGSAASPIVPARWPG